MAKVVGPLMSFDATGTVAGTATFSKWKGRNYVRQRVTPANPQTAAQTGVRTNMAGLVALYKANLATVKSNFATLAAQNSYSEFNAFTAFNQKRQSNGQAPAITPSPTEDAPSANATGLAASVNGKFISISWTDSVDTTAWAYQVYDKIGSDPTGARSEQIGLVRKGLQVLEIGPLPSGEHHICIRAADEQGGATALSTAVTATIA